MHAHKLVSKDNRHKEGYFVEHAQFSGITVQNKVPVVKWSNAQGSVHDVSVGTGLYL